MHSTFNQFMIVLINGRMLKSNPVILYIIKLMKYILLTLLAFTVFSQTVIVLSSPSTTTITLPVSQIVGAQAFHTLYHPNYLSNGAQWIFINGSDAWPNNYTSTFQTLFYVDCPQVSATLTITADNSFTAYLNGVIVGTGNNWGSKYNFTVKLICGLNNLTSVVVNKDQGSPQALIFSITQNQATCYSCVQNKAAFYNRNTCSCQCDTQCACSSRLQKWIGYPTCGCQCPLLQTLIAIPPCNATIQYYDSYSCGCQCKKTWCPPGKIQNQVSCACQCLPLPCPKGYHQNPTTCGCVKNVCVQVELCVIGKTFNHVTCKCE